jgi:hypothetical protein
MTRRRLLWAVPGLSLAIGVAATWLLASVPSESLPRVDRLDLLDVLFVLAFVAYAAVGALVATRQPRNAVGWLFCAAGLAIPLSGLLWSYAIYSVYADSLPADQWAAWVFAWSGEPLLLIVVLLLLLFPDGRFLTGRWRRLGYATVFTAIVWAAAIALDPGRLADFHAASNPVGIEGAAGLLEAVAGVASALETLLLVLAGVSIVVRYRRSEASERMQIKWLAATAALTALIVLVFGTLEATVETDRGTGELVTSVLAFLALALIPVGVGIAMLRHRLYDVDVVINRTLVYGALTAALVATYVGVVLLLQLALGPLTEDSGLAIAGSTLAVAALVRPLRGRIQATVDRRFYRRKYDAAQTIESFGTRLRDQVELDALSAELRGVVADTMQPAHVSLWLREARQ